uniref:Uncharacterized protein n=1 Tax=Anguilla anguilla TaxID=7936 RepID=A0A0E9WGJ8_ANGAN
MEPLPTKSAVFLWNRLSSPVYPNNSYFLWQLMRGKHVNIL